MGFLGTDVGPSVGTPGFECNVCELGSRILVGHFWLGILNSSINCKSLLAEGTAVWVQSLGTGAITAHS